MTILVTISLLAACRVGPAYRRPAIADTGVLSQREQTAPGDVASLADLRWFEVFKDEQLRQLVRTRARTITIFGKRRHGSRPPTQISASRARTNFRPRVSPRMPRPCASRAAATFPSQRASVRNEPSALWRSICSRSKWTFGAGFEARPKLRGADLLAAEENRKAIMTTLVSEVATRVL